MLYDFKGNHINYLMIIYIVLMRGIQKYTIFLYAAEYAVFDI